MNSRFTAYLLLAIFMTMSSCKPKNKARIKSLDNFALGEKAIAYECSGTPQAKANPTIKIILDRSGGLDTPELRSAAADALSAMPPKLLSAFNELRGAIVALSDPRLQCSGAMLTKDGKYPEGRNYEPYAPMAIDGCWTYSMDSSSLKVIIKRDVPTIRTDLVRVFGYAWSQFFARVAPSPKGLIVNVADSRTMSELKLRLANNFLFDLLATKLIPIENLTPLLGAPAIRSIKGKFNAKKTANLLEGATIRGSSSLDKTPAGGHDTDQVAGYIAAEAFHSFYCNAGAVSNKGAFDNLKNRKTAVTRAELIATLRQVKHSRASMAFLFPSTLRTFYAADRDLFSSAKSGFALAPGASGLNLAGDGQPQLALDGEGCDQGGDSYLPVSDPIDSQSKPQAFGTTGSVEGAVDYPEQPEQISSTLSGQSSQFTDWYNQQPVGNVPSPSNFGYDGGNGYSTSSNSKGELGDSSSRESSNTPSPSVPSSSSSSSSGSSSSGSADSDEGSDGSFELTSSSSKSGGVSSIDYALNLATGTISPPKSSGLNLGPNTSSLTRCLPTLPPIGKLAGAAERITDPAIRALSAELAGDAGKLSRAAEEIAHLRGEGKLEEAAKLEAAAREAGALRGAKNTGRVLTEAETLLKQQEEIAKAVKNDIERRSLDPNAILAYDEAAVAQGRKLMGGVVGAAMEPKELVETFKTFFKDEARLLEEAKDPAAKELLDQARKARELGTPEGMIEAEQRMKQYFTEHAEQSRGVHTIDDVTTRLKGQNPGNKLFEGEEALKEFRKLDISDANASSYGYRTKAELEDAIRKGDIRLMSLEEAKLHRAHGRYGNGQGNGAPGPWFTLDAPQTNLEVAQNTAVLADWNAGTHVSRFAVSSAGEAPAVVLVGRAGPKWDSVAGVWLQGGETQILNPKRLGETSFDRIGKQFKVEATGQLGQVRVQPR